MKGTCFLLVVFSATSLSAQRLTSDQVTFPGSGKAVSKLQVLAADASGSFSLSSAESSSATSESRGSRGPGRALVFGQARVAPDCPLCDISVYSYCGDRLLHDACCCLPPYQLPPQCNLADCKFLHAKSCHEHALITRCCCDQRLF